MLSKITADSVLDGDLTSNIKYSLEKTVNTQAAGEYPIEFRVMDSGGNTVYLKTQISISDKSYAGIDVNEYSCAVKPHVRSDGNRQSGTRKPLSASLLA